MSGEQEAPELVKRRYRPRGFYDAHKQEILTDLGALGYNRTLDKWDMTSATLVALRRRWGVSPRGQPRMGKGRP